MLVPVVRAFSLSRPAGLLRFRALDLLYAVVLGGMLRLIQGFVEAAGGAAGFPAAPTAGGRVPTSWWLTEVLPSVAVAPVVEEFFFRAVLLISIYTILRRGFGAVAAGLAAAVVSTGFFVALHAFTTTASVDGIVATALLGMVCAALVMLTGRIWGAVLLHIVYSSTYVALALVGTL